MSQEDEALFLFISISQALQREVHAVNVIFSHIFHCAFFKVFKEYALSHLPHIQLLFAACISCSQVQRRKSKENAIRNTNITFS